MQNGIFKLDWASVADMVITAVVAAVLVALYADVTTVGFNVASANWSVIGNQMLTVGLIAGVTSLAKDFLSTTNGSILAVGPTN